MTDLYEILGVKPTATAQEIKRAHRDLAKRFHPDRTGGDRSKESRLKEINAAYEILSDPAKRRQYDAMRAGPMPGAGVPGGMPFDLSDLFGGLGGAAAGGRRGGGPAGFGGFTDLFEQIFGAEAGRGNGARVVYEYGPTAGRRAAGRPHPEPPERTIRASDGSVLARKGDDVHGEVRIALDEAVLGARVDVATLDGRATVSIPPGTSSGTRLRLRGKGVGGRGDLFVTVQIKVPRDVDERARELIREFARRTR